MQKLVWVAEEENKQIKGSDERLCIVIVQFHHDVLVLCDVFESLGEVRSGDVKMNGRIDLKTQSHHLQ
jgi:hypothetical protein